MTRVAEESKRRAFAHALQSIARTGSKGQVMIATHSTFHLVECDRQAIFDRPKPAFLAPTSVKKVSRLLVFDRHREAD